MYRSSNADFGLPPRLYRTTEEIRCDISSLKSKIKEVNDRLNIRNFLVDLIADAEEREPEIAVRFLEDALTEAEEALVQLSEFKEELLLLEDELYEVRCALVN